jgi:hypothetical protein
VTPARRDLLSLAALGVTALALRVPFLPAYDEDLDTLRFRLAVERFDITELRPHAPFYPVYLAPREAHRRPRRLPARRPRPDLRRDRRGPAHLHRPPRLRDPRPPRRAPRCPLRPRLPVPLAQRREARQRHPRPRPRSPHPSGSSPARVASPSARSSLRTSAIVLLGLGLGVRLSYFPFAIACTWLVARAEGGPRALLARARDLAAGVALWLAPLILVAGARPLVAVTFAQTLGHFGQWGGSALTVSSPAARLYGLAWGLWANLLGGAWIDAPASRWIVAPILLALLLLGARRALPLREALRLQPELAISMIAYFAWALLGQNTAGKPRHWLPLLPLLILALAAGADTLLTRAHRAAIALPLLLAPNGSSAAPPSSAPTAILHRSPPPRASSRATAATDPRLVIAGDAARLLLEGAPSRTIRWAQGDDALLHALIDTGERGALISSEALSPCPPPRARAATLHALPRLQPPALTLRRLPVVRARPPRGEAPDFQ